MTRPLRITFLTGRLNLSGGIRVVRIVSDRLVERGHDVTIVYLDRPIPWPKFWKARQWFRRARQEWKNRGKQRHHMDGCRARLIGVRDPAHDYPQVPDADVAIATWWETAEWMQAWPASKGKRAYYIQHHELHGGPEERVAATYRLPYKKLVIAKWLQRGMARQYGDADTVLVPNGVEWELFDSVPRSKAPVPTVGFMYGVQPYKGAALAIQAIRLMKQAMPGLRVLCFGSKPYGPDIAAPEYIEFELRPPQSRIADIYRSADCWLLPSAIEGFGLPGLEAAACRCPVVTTQCGGPEDYVVDGETGYIVPVGDANAMATKALSILQLNDPEWRAMSEASYRKAREFDWARTVPVFERALYDLAGISEPQVEEVSP